MEKEIQKTVKISEHKEIAELSRRDSYVKLTIDVKLKKAIQDYINLYYELITQFRTKTHE